MLNNIQTQISDNKDPVWERSLFGEPVLSLFPSRDERAKLRKRYAGVLSTNSDLTRARVSFQANKIVPFYRWFKYREGFSSELVRYLIDKFRSSQAKSLRVLDPFAGAGTTLTTATKAGCKAMGIELLPVGTAAIRARLVADRVNIEEFTSAVRILKSAGTLEKQVKYVFPHLAITEKAFSKNTESDIGAFLKFTELIHCHPVERGCV